MCCSNRVGNRQSGQARDATWTKINLRNPQPKHKSHRHWHKHTKCEVILQMCSLKSREDHNNKAISRALLACCLIVSNPFNYLWSAISSLPPPTDRQTDMPLCTGGGRGHTTGCLSLGYLRSPVICCWPVQYFLFGQDPQLPLTTENLNYTITCFPKLLCWHHSTLLLWTSSPLCPASAVSNAISGSTSGTLGRCK